MNNFPIILSQEQINDVKIESKFNYLNYLIKNSIDNITNNFLLLGKYLFYINKDNLYINEYNSIYDYCFQNFKIKETSVKNLISIYKEFCIHDNLELNSVIVKSEFKNFNYSQLCEMLSLSDDERKLINVSDSVKDIRFSKKMIKLYNDFKVKTNPTLNLDLRKSLDSFIDYIKLNLKWDIKYSNIIYNCSNLEIHSLNNNYCDAFIKILKDSRFNNLNYFEFKFYFDVNGNFNSIINVLILENGYFINKTFNLNDYNFENIKDQILKIINNNINSIQEEKINVEIQQNLQIVNEVKFNYGETIYELDNLDNLENIVNYDCFDLINIINMFNKTDFFKKRFFNFDIFKFSITSYDSINLFLIDDCDVYLRYKDSYIYFIFNENELINFYLDSISVSNIYIIFTAFRFFYYDSKDENISEYKKLYELNNKKNW